MPKPIVEPESLDGITLRTYEGFEVTGPIERKEAVLEYLKAGGVEITSSGYAPVAPNARGIDTSRFLIQGRRDPKT